ncbi:MAG: EamA family transporter [Chitinophagaceae bacterium]|nr:EamA family transporter [Chitinophagaceae bacterium]MCW5928744.1 EamA family transporter [Chitinophagaceae bacterium]
MKNYIYDVYDKVRILIEPVYLRNQTQRTRALLAVGVVCILWGTTWLASKKGVEYMPALQLAGLRQLSAGIIYLGYLYYKGFRLPNRQQFIQFFLMGMLLIVINNGLSTWSMKFMPSGLGAVIGAASPLWIALLSTFIFKESKLNIITIAGLLLGTGGILFIFSDYLHDLLNSSFSLGIVLNVIASIAWALGTIYTVKNARHVDPYFSLGWQMFLGGIVLLLASRVTGQYVPVKNIPLQSVYSIGYLVLIGSVAAYSAFIYALKRLPAAQVSIHAYINPIVAIVVGALLNNEKLNFVIAAGTAVTLLGIFLVNTGFKKQRKEE